MVPLELDGEIRRADQGVRPGTDLATLATLKPAFRAEHGRITAGRSSPIIRWRRDGAARIAATPRGGSGFGRVPGSSIRPPSASTRSSC